MYSYEYNRDKENKFTIRCDPDINICKHFHNCFEFIYVIEGKAIAHIDSNIYNISSGQLCAVSCFSTHYYETLEEGKYIVALIPRRYFRGYEAEFNAYNFANPIIDDNESSSLLNIMQMALAMANKVDIFGEPLTNAENFIEKSLCYLSAYLINICIQHCGLHERHRISSLVADAVGLIEDNFRNDISVTSICKKLGCNQKELSYHFRKTMDMSILAYIERTRVLEVERLLNSNPEMTIEAVMMQSGFKSNRSFLRHFKETFNCTPTEYKIALKISVYSYINSDTLARKGECAKAPVFICALAVNGVSVDTAVLGMIIHRQGLRVISLRDTYGIHIITLYASIKFGINNKLTFHLVSLLYNQRMAMAVYY